MIQLVLASASPRRKELLEQLGYQFALNPVDIDETPFTDELPAQYLPRMSKSKALYASKELDCDKQTLILASDTSVIAQGRILGKPRDKAHFIEMMESMSGQWHEVMTSIAVLTVSPNDEKVEPIEQTVVTRVKFNSLSKEQIEAYWLTGEPCDKAGGYGIQGKGAIFVERIEGSYSNVVGLPLQETANLLSAQGIDICKIWLESA